MSNRILIPAALLVGLLAGLGIGLVLGGDAVPPARTGAAADAPKTDRAPDRRADRTGETRRASTPRRAAQSSQADTNAAAPDELVIRDLPTPEPETGSGTITGTIRTPSGEPVEGALVRASPRKVADHDDDDYVAPGDLPDDGLEALVRAYAEEKSLEIAARREAQSAADGTYTLTGIGDASYRVEARLDQHLLSLASGSAGARVRASAVVDFVAEPLIDVPISVVEPGGGQPDRATIDYTQGGRKHSQRWTPEQGVIRLKSGDHSLTAYAGAYHGLRSDAVRVNVTEGMSATEIALLDRPAIAGHAIPVGADTSGDSGRVHLLRVSSGVPPTPERVEADGDSKWVSPYNDYEFVFRDLEPGTYYIGATRSGAPLDAATAVQVGSALVEQDVPFAEPRRSDYVLVRVTGPDGEPLHDIEIGTGFATHGMSSRSSGGSRTPEADGSYHVTHQHVDPSNRGKDGSKYFITVESERYGEREVEYELGPAPEVNIQFDEPSALTVQLSGLRSEWTDKTQVSVERKEEDPADDDGVSLHSGSNAHSGVDASGTAIFDRLVPGTYTVFASVGGHRVVRQTAVVGSGRTVARLSIPGLHRLAISAPQAPGADVSIQRSASEAQPGYWDHRPVGKTGQVIVEFLPPGEYTIRLDPEGDAETIEKIVSIPGTSELRFP